MYSKPVHCSGNRDEPEEQGSKESLYKHTGGMLSLPTVNCTTRHPLPGVKAACTFGVKQILNMYVYTMYM